MFSRFARRRFSISSAVTRRWIRSRPGSVLILVIALLVLLALIGTAYLSSTQTERYTSVQNTINTQADLLIDGLVLNVEGRITSSLFGTGSNGQQFRPPSQEMWPAAAVNAPTATGYNAFTSPATDDFLAERIPSLLNSTYPFPVWHSSSWSPFLDSTGIYKVDSPFDPSISLTSLAFKDKIQSIPTARPINGKIYPAMLYCVPPSTPTVDIPTSNGVVYTHSFGNLDYLTIDPVTKQPILIQATAGVPIPTVCGSATGEGIADAPLFKIPIGPINGITYYGAIRVIDNNSAVNVTTAWSAAIDPSASDVKESTINGATPTPQTANYGFFRSNVGLRELFYSKSEMDNLNYYRFNNAKFVPALSPANPFPATASPALNNSPVDETGTPLTTFSYYSTSGNTVDVTSGDPIEMQLARRVGNPGYNISNTGGATPQKFSAFGLAENAALAHSFSLVNNHSNPSLIEQLLPYETTFNPNSFQLYPSTPYSPSNLISSTFGTAPKSGFWFDDLYNFNNLSMAFTTQPIDFPTQPRPPLRTMLTASNPVSNGIPSRINDVGVGGAAYLLTQSYHFGDWITYSDPVSGIVNSFVCLTPNTGIKPPTLPPSVHVVAPLPVDPSLANRYWTYVPWKTQPVKASIHTATFEQLYINFCHLMTDSIDTSPGQEPQWNPPMLPNGTTNVGQYGEEQMPQFRSIIRDNRKWPMSNAGNTGQPSGANLSPNFASGRVQLTAMQMMQLRAAIAAINTVNIRNLNTSSSTRMTRSRRLILSDNLGNPAFEAEVFGNDVQPYIGQMFAQVNGPVGDVNNFIAIQLINPSVYDDITMGASWVFATMDRLGVTTNPNSGTANLTLTLQSNGATTLRIPKAALPMNGGNYYEPGKLTIYDGNVPNGFTLPNNAKAVSGLAQAFGKELVILRPRRFDGTTVTSLHYTSPQAAAAAANDYFDRFDETNHIYDLVPVDQLDLTGLDTISAPLNNVYYRRAADPKPNMNNPTYAWNFVWPGFYTPYNASNTAAGSPITQPPYTPYIPSTTSYSSIYKYNQPFIVTITQPSINTIDFDKLCTGAGDTSVPDQTAPTYDTIPLQLISTSLPGINPILTGAMNNRFPFGGFARNADMLQIPYIGAYRIIDAKNPPDNNVTTPGGFYEMNSVTMDAALANDSTLQPSETNSMPATTQAKVFPITSSDTVAEPFKEQIGHFCPVGDTAPAALDNVRLDFSDAATNPSRFWHYHWAKRLFDYFTVQAPHDDYFPNVDPDLEYAYYNDATRKTLFFQAPATPISVAPVPDGTINGSAITGNVGEDLIGVEGLININTAPWPVLATLPFVPRRISATSSITTDYISYDVISGIATSVVNSVDDNIDIAKAIVDYRNTNGPFRSMMDLYNVPAFRMENDQLLSQTTGDPSIGVGDFSPSGLTSTMSPVPTDGVRFDFEERFLLLNHISNLITTRSDTFTCYVDLQGWRNVGTGNPTLAVERRKAFIFDRNAYTPVYKNPIYFPVPAN